MVSLHSRPPDIQYAALPYRRGALGLIEVLLITSRGSGKWIIPKGKPMAGLSGAATAAQEAFEEAGVSGVIDTHPIGRFSYLKDEGQVSERLISAIDVYPLKVEQQFTLWPEMGQRRLLWLDLPEAAAVIKCDALSRIIKAFGSDKRHLEAL